MQHTHDAHDTHITKPPTYLAVFAALVVLTLLTVGAAFLDLGPLNNLVAALIAIAKAILIVLFFMHVRHSDGQTKLVVLAGWVWLLILMGGVFDDLLTRGWLYVPKPWQ